jgi:hypothetical protein
MNQSSGFLAGKFVRILVSIAAGSFCPVLLTGCQPEPIEFAIVDCSAQRFQIKLTRGKQYIFWGAPVPASFYSVGFYSDKSYTDKSLLWKVKSDPGLASLDILTYGSIPQELDANLTGTVEATLSATKATSLQPGKTIFVKVETIGSFPAETEFKVC